MQISVALLYGVSGEIFKVRDRQGSLCGLCGGWLSDDADARKSGILEARNMRKSQGCLSMLPLVIYEDSIRLFNFYYDGAIRQGMSYKSKLYKLVKSCQHSSRLQLYGFGCSLANHGIETVITASEQDYKVWVEVSAKVSI